jgi:putative transposase
MVAAPVRRELVRWMQTKGLSERRGLRVVGMSPSALRYVPRPDRNGPLRSRIVALAQRHRRYGVGMIYLKLRQAGEVVNYKRVERLYGIERGRMGTDLFSPVVVWLRSAPPASRELCLEKQICPH